MNKNKKNRSLSPHLSIYKSQITSLVSIFHRISGSILGLLLLLVPFFICLSYSFISYNLFCVVLQFFLYIISFIYFIFFSTLIFHFMNGVRHILWDFCFGLELTNLFITGCFVLFFSFFLSLIFIFF